MRATPAKKRNLIGLYSAWRVDDEALGDPTDRQPDFHIEARVATFEAEPSALLKSSARMARRDAFPLKTFEMEEIGSRFVEDAIAISMDELDGWFELAPSGDLAFAKRMDNRFQTLGRTRFVTDAADLAATLQRHGLPEAWATDRTSPAWKPAPRRGPSFEEFTERLRDFGRDQVTAAQRQRRRGGIEL